MPKPDPTYSGLLRGLRVASLIGCLVLFCLQLPFLWPRWFGTAGELIAGVCFIGTAMVFGWMLKRNPTAESTPEQPIWHAIAVIFVVAFAFGSSLPRLVRVGLILGGLCSSMLALMPARERNTAFTLSGMLMLSLPVSPSLQFLFGYPLRVLAGQIACLALPGDAEAVGTGILFRNSVVFVDAPCSGINILWVSMLLALIAAMAFRTCRAWTLVLLGSSVGIAVLANVVRTAFLCLLTAAGGFSSTLETVVGVLVFAFAASAICGVAWLGSILKLPKFPELRAMPDAVGHGVVVLVCLAMIPAAIAAARTSAPAQGNPAIDVEWPLQWNKQSLQREPLSRESEQFAARFPGGMAQFTTGNATVLFRFTERPTRMMHPAEDCYEGIGFQVKPLPAEQDAAGHLWSRFEYTRSDGETRVVRQCYFEVNGSDLSTFQPSAGTRSWPDASSWFWHAESGGTLAVTIDEAVE